MASTGDDPRRQNATVYRGRPVGLRERKKVKTRAAMQRHALRLFRKQGYEETTVEQIAAAAEVSPATFYHYFPTKEDVVLYDVLDPILFASFRDQPPEMSPLSALRAAMRAAFRAVPPAEIKVMIERTRLMRDVPALRARMLSDMVGTVEVFA
jgi:AcrR family transcriptional regulator